MSRQIVQLLLVLIMVSSLTIGTREIISSTQATAHSTQLSCEALKCPPLPSDLKSEKYQCTNSNNLGSACTVICKQNYGRVGNKTFTCEHKENPNKNTLCGEASWSAEKLPICRALFCPVLDEIENGEMSCTKKNKLGSLCRFKCNLGYTILPEDHQGNLCYKKSEWIGQIAFCIPVCDILSQILVDASKTECWGPRLGDPCNNICPAPFTLNSGASNETCQYNETCSSDVPCCHYSCPPHARVDLFFLLDSSSSVGEKNWRSLICFIFAVLDEFEIDSPDYSDMIVGVARYNSRLDLRSQIVFGNYDDKHDLKRKISYIPYDGEGTWTGRALRHLVRFSLNRPGNRPDAPDIIVVITDGKATDPVGVAAKNLHNRDQTTVYAVGVRNLFHELNIVELMTIASDPKYMHIMDGGYEQLVTDFKNTLAMDICMISCQ